MKISGGNLLWILLGVFLVIFMLLWEAADEPPIDWSASYLSSDKKPFGCYVLSERMKDLFPEKEVKPFFKSLYEMMNEVGDDFYNYISVNHTFHSGYSDTRALLDFVNNGGYAFLAAEHFSGELADSLHILTKRNWLKKDSLEINFESSVPDKTKKYFFRNNDAPYYFNLDEMDSVRILAKNWENEPVLIEFTYGNGYFYLCSIPLAFTNYYLLKSGNESFASNCLSFLLVENTLLDEYRKAGREEIKNPLRFILSRKELRWAFYLALGALLLYVIFEGKRKQRPVPVIEPLQNTSLEFIEVVGGLHFRTKDHKNIALKKINHFGEYLRTQLFIKNLEENEEAYHKIAAKTGADTHKVRELILLIKKIQNSSQIGEKDLMNLDALIEDVKNPEFKVK